MAKKDFQKSSEKDEKKSSKKDYKGKSESKGKSPKKDFKRKAGDSLTYSKKKKVEVETEEISQKQLKKERQMRKPNASIIEQAKQIWNEVRDRNVTEEKRKELLEELYVVIKGNIPNIVLRHDAGRVVQCALKFGTPEQRSEIIKELEDNIIDLMKHMYSKFLVQKMLKYGNRSDRDLIIGKTYGSIRSLLKHAEASAVLEAVYTDYASSPQKKLMVQELYSSSYALFKEKTITIEDIKEMEPEKKEKIVKFLERSLLAFINKKTFRHSLVHRAFLDYFLLASPDQKREFSSNLKEILVEILHTYEGAQVAMHCIYNSSAKERKAIVKSLKTFVYKICNEEYGQKVLFAIFDCVDDTVLIKNIIFSEIKDHYNEVLNDKLSRRVVLYVLAPRDVAFFHNSTVEQLVLGDGNIYSKKDKEVRRRELVNGLQQTLSEYISTNCEPLITYGISAQVIEKAVVSFKGEARSKIVDSIIQLVRSSGTDEDGMINNRVSGMIIKRLITSLTEEDDENELFALTLWDAIKKKVAAYIEHKQACYTIGAMFNEKLPLDFKQGVAKELKKINLSKYPQEAPHPYTKKMALTPQGALQKELENFVNEN